MTKWDYLTIHIRYDGKNRKNWVLEYADGQPLVGMPEILNAYGADGWELVSLAPEDQEAYPGLGKYRMEPVAYRATFKRASEY